MRRRVHQSRLPERRIEMGMNRTTIEWVKNPDGSQGFTWNPVTGCLNHINGLCKGGGFPCYAYKLANGRLRQRYLANQLGNAPLKIEYAKTVPHYPIEPTSEDYTEYTRHCLNDPFYPRFWMNRIEELDKASEHEWGRGRIVKHSQYPKGIFVCDMGELFGDWIPEGWQNWVFEIIKRQPQHRFYLLTKQPQNLPKWSPFPDNCWVGVSVTDTGMAYKAVNNLKRIEAKVKYISFEPLLGRIINWVGDAEYLFKDLDWLIIGAQTKPYKAPRIEWVEEIVRAADQAGIKVFLKDNLMPLLLEQEKLPIWAMAKWIKGREFKLRQEMPPSEGKGGGDADS